MNRSSISINNKRIARNTLFLTIRMVFVLGLTLYTTRIVLKELGVIDYGIYNVVCGFISMFAFLNISMSNGIQRFFNFELGKNGKDGANRVYNTALIIQLLLVLILLLTTESVGVWYINYKMMIPFERLFAANWIFQSSLLSLIFIIMQAPYTAAVMAHERMDFYAVISVLDAVLKLAITFMIHIFIGDRLILYGILMAFISIVNFIIYYIYCKHNFVEIKWHKKFSKNLFKSMLGFSGWNIFGSFSGMMKEQGINLVLNFFYGPVVNAARGIAVQINSGLHSFVNNIVIPVRPQIIQSYAAGNIDRTINLTYSISKLSCFCLYLISLPILYNVNWILTIWLGDNIPENTNVFVIVVILISFLNNLNATSSIVVHATGKMKLYQLSTSFSALLAIPLSYIGLKKGLPPVFAFWMVFFTMILAQIIAVVVLGKLINISLRNYLKKIILPIVEVILLTSWLPYILAINQLDGCLRFIITTIASLVTTSIVIYSIGLNVQEKGLIKDFVNKFKR